jgi:hypothetical protein
MQGKHGGTVDFEPVVVGVVVVVVSGFFFATTTEQISETANAFIILLFL